MERIKIAEVSTQIRGVSYKPSDLRDSTDPEAVILLRANNIGEGKINFDDIVYVDKKRITEDQYLKKGDILICASSGSKNLVGKAAGFDLDVKCTFGAFCKVVRPTECNPEYLSLYFMSDAYGRKITASAIGANINNIRNEHIDSLEINIYPEEENEIICKLRAIRQIVEFRKSQLSALDTLIKARFVEMFGDIGSGAYRHDCRRLGDVAYVGSSHRVFTTEFVDEGIPFYRGTEIGELSNGVQPENPFYITEEHYQRLTSDETKPKIGDLLMPSICNKGQVWMVDTEKPFYYKDGRVLCISADRMVFNTKYLQYFMREKTELEYPKLGSGSTFAEFKIFQLKGMEVLTPPIELQNAFAAFVSEVDKSKFYGDICAAFCG